MPGHEEFRKNIAVVYIDLIGIVCALKKRNKGPEN
jgi:hypothetical protein